jgi:hypothetical protein
MNPQNQSAQPQRKDPGSNPPKQAPAQGQTGKTGSDRNPQPENPADLGNDPTPDNVQAHATSRATRSR